MAKKQSQSPTEKAAPDPTVFSGRGAVPEYPEGTHPPVAPSDQTWGPYRFSYSDLEEKPDETTVAQQVESDPVVDKNQEALRKDAEALAKAEPESSK